MNVPLKHTRTVEGITSRIRELIPELRAGQSESDRLGRPPEALIEKLRATGIYRIAMPQALGGADCNMRGWMDAIAELARGDAGIAWGVNLVVTCNWTLASYFPKHIVEEVFSDPKALVAGVFSSRTCKAKPVEGGILVEKGHWFFNSGVYQAQWDLLGVPTFNADGTPGSPGIALVPMSDVNLLHDWDVSGMRGSGSTNVSMENVFIPHERIVKLGPITTGAHKPTYPGPLARTAFWPVMVAILGYPVIGAGEHMIEAFLESLPKRDIKLTFYDSAAKAPVTHLQLGEACAKIESARVIAENAARLMDEWAERGELMPKLVRARIFRDSAYANRLVWEGVDVLASASGGSFARHNNIANRIWQDVKIGTMHAMISPASNLENYGRVLAGIEPDMMIV